MAERFGARLVDQLRLPRRKRQYSQDSHPGDRWVNLFIVRISEERFEGLAGASAWQVDLSMKENRIVPVRLRISHHLHAHGYLPQLA